MLVWWVVGWMDGVQEEEEFADAGPPSDEWQRKKLSDDKQLSQPAKRGEWRVSPPLSAQWIAVQEVVKLVVDWYVVQATDLYYFGNLHRQNLWRAHGLQEEPSPVADCDVTDKGFGVGPKLG